MQQFYVLKRNVYKIIAKFDVPPMMHPSFLCKSLKYTSCTVFGLKFIHYGNDVKTVQKISAIFVRFPPLSLQFASFFFFLPLVSYLYTTDALQRRPCKQLFFYIRRRTKMSKAISRRDFLKVSGAVGAAGLLAACGGSGNPPPPPPLPLLLPQHPWPACLLTPSP